MVRDHDLPRPTPSAGAGHLDQARLGLCKEGLEGVPGGDYASGRPAQVGQMLRDAGVPFTAYFMAGFPGETDDDLLKTIEFAREIQADYYSLSVVAPYFGTKMYYDLVDEGVELDKKPWEYFFHQTGELMANTKISRNVLEQFLAINETNKEGKGYI